MLNGGECGALQVEPRVLSAQADPLNQRVEEGEHLGATQSLGAVVILAAQHQVAQLALHQVVVQGHPRVGEEDGEPAPQLQRLLKGPARTIAWQRALSQYPLADAATSRTD